MQTLISKIEILVAEKARMQTNNEFNYFIFKYKGKLYKLLDDELIIVKSKNVTFKWYIR